VRPEGRIATIPPSVRGQVTLVVLARFVQVVEEAADRHVGDREQAIEDEAVSRGQFAAIGFLPSDLRGRKCRPDQVVHQGQLEARAWLAMAEFVQVPQDLERPRKRVIGTLGIVPV
jgi:hypothetical protein